MGAPVINPILTPAAALLPPIAKRTDGTHVFTGPLQGSIDRVLDTMPRDAKAVILDVAKGPRDGTVTGVFAFRTKSNWELLVGTGIVYEGEFEVEDWNVQVRKVFK